MVEDGCCAHQLASNLLSSVLSLFGVHVLPESPHSSSYASSERSSRARETSARAKPLDEHVHHTVTCGPSTNTPLLAIKSGCEFLIHTAQKHRDPFRAGYDRRPRSAKRKKLGPAILCYINHDKPTDRKPKTQKTNIREQIAAAALNNSESPVPVPREGAGKCVCSRKTHVRAGDKSATCSNSRRISTRQYNRTTQQHTRSSSSTK